MLEDLAMLKKVGGAEGFYPSKGGHKMFNPVLRGRGGGGGGRKKFLTHDFPIL